MDDNLTIYEVQTDDTLISIASKIGMSDDELRDFHNANCQKVGLVYFNGLTGIKKVVLPKSYKSPVQIIKENSEAVPPRHLPRNFYANTYDAEESFSGDNENRLQISYLVDIRLEELNESERQDYIAYVRCHDFKKDGVKPDDKMSELSIACIESISPLIFNIRSEGQISGVHNIGNTQETFNQKRKDLEDFFIGEVSTKYMDKFADSLSNETYFLNQIKSTLFYQILFPKMDWFHYQNSWSEKFYLVKNSFPVNCNCIASFNHIDEDIIETTIRGEVSESISLQELLRGRRSGEEPEEPLQGSIELKYTTQKETKQLLSAEAHIVLMHDGEIYRDQKINLKQN